MEVVSFEIAKKLKEKGFREKVNAYYGKHENIFDVHPALDMNDADYRASAPTISQVLKWLREEKKIFVAIDYYPAGYNADIYTGLSKKDGFFDNEQYINECDCYNTYELAAIAGIEYCLDNLI